MSAPDLLTILRRPITRTNAEVALLCEAALKAADEIERLRSHIRQMERDAREDARGIATEASWQERQGDEYGSY